MKGVGLVQDEHLKIVQIDTRDNNYNIKNEIGYFK